ncbi:MAG: C2H2-type zinc finger protein [Nitrososphaerota archaeon]
MMREAMKDVLEIKLEGMNKLSNSFAYLLSEKLIDYNAFAFIKRDVIALDLSNASDYLTLDKIVEIIHECMNNLELKNNYVITIEGNKLVVKITNPSMIQEVERKYSGQPQQLFMCPHCGYVTTYPELLREHIKIHYLI